MNKIRNKREERELTLSETGERVGVSGSTVGAWERGERKPKPKNRTKLARVLNCTVYDLFPSLEIKKALEPERDTQPSLPSPFAKHPGLLELGEAKIDCYVLDTGDRVISMRATVEALTGTEHGKLHSYLKINALEDLIDVEQVLKGTVEFYLPGTGVPMIARGLKAETLLNICNAYVEAMERGLLTTGRQREIATKSSMLIRACAKTGLIALIDEATGYQYERAEDALQIKLRAFIADEMRDWEKTFPDALWEELGRLTGWSDPLHHRPRWWGKLVMELIYDALDPDIAQHLRENKPTPRGDKKYHRWMTENYGLPKLIEHINQVIGVAKTCDDLQELRDEVALHYGREPVQLKLHLPSQK